MGFGENIKKYRKQAGLTQRQLAERVGAATGTIQQYELGKREPRFEQITKIARVLNVEEYDLIGYDSWLLNVQGVADAHAVWGQRGYTFLQNEQELIALFSQLNKAGKATAIERISELTEISKYTSKED